jgi:putative nucleotidyltransferase with HDIG domain
VRENRTLHRFFIQKTDKKTPHRTRLVMAPGLHLDCTMSAHSEPSRDLSGSPDVRAARSVLVVDDENVVRDLMSRWLEAGGYSVASAAGADEALGLMQTRPPAVALCDIRMPGRDGLWLADRIRQNYPETAVIMATGIHDLGAAAVSLREGVVDYLTKPFGRDRLQDAVVRGIEWHRSARDSRCWRERLEKEVETRRAQLVESIGNLPVDSDTMLDEAFAALTAGDAESRAHAHRVAELALSVARQIGLTEEAVTTVRRAALLHDLGKLSMPDALLRKPAPLTADERAIIRRHPQIGSDLVAGIPYAEEAAAIVRHAQERVDGMGYPEGLRLADISVGARIVAAADAYDTMIRPRVFRDAISAADALLELDRCAGTQFDPYVVRVLKSLVVAH